VPILRTGLPASINEEQKLSTDIAYAHRDQEEVGDHHSSGILHLGDDSHGFGKPRSRNMQRGTMRRRFCIAQLLGWPELLDGSGAWCPLGPLCHSWPGVLARGRRALAPVDRRATARTRVLCQYVLRAQIRRRSRQRERELRSRQRDREWPRQYRAKV